MILLLVLFFIFFPVLSIPIVIFLFLKTNQYNKIYILMISVTLGGVALYFIPPTNYDLYQHFLKMDLLIRMDFFEAVTFSPLIVENLWFYLVALSGNYNLLAVSAVIITYYFSLLTIFGIGRYCNVDKKWILFLFFLFLAWFQLILPMSGVRFSTAISLTAYGVYSIYLKRKIGYYFIVIAALIHIGVVYIVAIFMLVKLFRYKIFLLSGLIIVGSILIENISQILSLIPVSYVQLLVQRIFIYQELTITNFFDEFLYYLMLLLNLILLLILAFKKPSFVKLYGKEAYAFYMIFIITNLSFYYIPTVVSRYTYFLFIFFPILILPFFNALQKYLRILIILLFINLIGLGLYIQYIQLNPLEFEVTLLEYIFKGFWGFSKI
ncbi:EpsG family protein [Caryophanon latum]|uniref:EpsG family protein n=1 Tax=Caryophanon latum TaxID=33977 RepID=A0A1C0YIQ9_9BACL|nr:EpsG family protein [Caryophanon latum]OCS87060.1 hypothetical protein A6K76_14095 [Caryophanon latum]